MQTIEDALPDFFYHRWLIAWIRWQFKLDIATFHPRREILVVTDFAALYKMKGKQVSVSLPGIHIPTPPGTILFSHLVGRNPQVGTCEHGISCSQLVALVLYLPGEVTEQGAPRPVRCDYWRIWSNARHSPEYHHAAMRRIARYYKGMQVPGLVRVKVWSDGDPTTYKGRKNFGRMVRWPRSSADGGEGVELHHNCLPAHHGAGAQDNAGKDPRRYGTKHTEYFTQVIIILLAFPTRRAMDRAIIHEKANTIYSYWKCYAWCVKHMAKPTEEKDHRGTFGCNGRYIWGAFSDGTDPNPLGCDVLDPRDRDFRAIDGSADMYAFRARNPDPGPRTRVLVRSLLLRWLS
jgi:hypothetical protein